MTKKQSETEESVFYGSCLKTAVNVVHIFLIPSQKKLDSLQLIVKRHRILPISSNWLVFFPYISNFWKRGVAKWNEKSPLLFEGRTKYQHRRSFEAPLSHYSTIVRGKRSLPTFWFPYWLHVASIGFFFHAFPSLSIAILPLLIVFLLSYQWLEKR